jgi:hypothetical protein
MQKLCRVGMAFQIHRLQRTGFESLVLREGEFHIKADNPLWNILYLNLQILVLLSVLALELWDIDLSTDFE